MDYMEAIQMSRYIDIPQADAPTQDGHKGIQDGVAAIARALNRFNLVIEVINCGSKPHNGDNSDKEAEPIYLSLTDTLVLTPGALQQQAEELHTLIDGLLNSLTLTGVQV